MNVSFGHFAVIDTLDLDKVKLKLMHVESGEGWDRARAEAAEAQYRRFLHLMKKYPEERIAPTVDADIFWHYHILDTVKYAEDCDRIFGYFLHHDPYLGLGENARHDDHSRAGERMRELYEAEFGATASELPRESAWCTVTAGDAAPTLMTAKTAWCTVAAAGTAWCTVARSPNTAWCTVAHSPKTAWCTVASAPKTAWCTVTRSPETAWCTVAAPRRNTAPVPAARMRSSAACPATA